jgi:Uncharacterized protein conserved in bacteria (DUF2252)
MLADYAGLCGQMLARAHAKSGDAAIIAGYLGNGSVFDEAVAHYALAYADQVEKDYQSFQAAIPGWPFFPSKRSLLRSSRPFVEVRFPASMRVS